MTDLTLTVAKTINAPIANVFDAWLNAETLSKFMLPMQGMPEPATKIDAVEGGNFTIIMQVGDEKIPHNGSYQTIDRPNTLIFTWHSPSSTDDSLVTIKFNAIDENTTEVELTHDKFLDQQVRDNHEGGWRNILEKLKATVE